MSAISNRRSASFSCCGRCQSGYKAARTRKQQIQLQLDLVGLPEGEYVSVETAEQASSLIRKRLAPEAQDYLLSRVMLAAIDRFSATRSVQDASSVVHSVCDAEAERTESELSIIRYIAWAIPSVGFIGTVRGIGNALGQAHRAVEGDITGVTQSLGVAFNSTFIAVLISIVLMFLIHALQSSQERLVLDVRGIATTGSSAACARSNACRHEKAEPHAVRPRLPGHHVCGFGAGTLVMIPTARF